jgi:hypothetical protein
MSRRSLVPEGFILFQKKSVVALRGGSDLAAVLGAALRRATGSVKPVRAARPSAEGGPKRTGRRGRVRPRRRRPEGSALTGSGPEPAWHCRGAPTRVAEHATPAVLSATNHWPSCRVSASAVQVRAGRGGAGGLSVCLVRAMGAATHGPRADARFTVLGVEGSWDREHPQGPNPALHRSTNLR